jgi:hypothetical protein
VIRARVRRLTVLGRLRSPLYAFEWFAVLSTALVVVFLRANHLRVGWRAFNLTVPPMLWTLPKILVAGVAIHVVLTWFGRRSVRAYLVGFLRPASLLLWLRVCFATMLTAFAYPWLKVSVPLLNERLWDAELWRLDRWLHFGVAPNVFAVELFRNTPLVAPIDRWYALWITSIFVAWSWSAAHPEPSRRRNFALGCAILSSFGAWIYFSVPALGPCYAYPETFAPVRAELPHATAAQATLGANYAKMVAGRDGTLRQFNPFFGVAAMPSLHVGAHWLFALWARRWAPRMFRLCVGVAALTFVGSIVTGWHYAVDGYVGALLAWGACHLAARLEPIAETEPETVEPTTGDGAAPPELASPSSPPSAAAPAATPESASS